MADGKLPAFAGDGPEKIFRDGLAAGEFKIQRCNACNEVIYYPRTVCNHCGAADFSWFTASGKGTVYSTSVERAREPADNANTCVVALEEGGRLQSRVVDCDPTDVTIGMPVTAFVGEIGETKVILFRPAEG